MTINLRYIERLLLSVIAFLLLITVICDASSINGTLRISSVNPRYFTDLSGRAVYLTGSHTWNNLVDMDSTYPPHQFDFNAYLNFLERYNHNFIRLWAWEVPRPQSSLYERRQYASPSPWLRTGPGVDITGLAKFDLGTFDQTYFDRLRARVLAAYTKGIYVSVMLFEGWAVQFEPGKSSHPFNPSNNINGIDYGSSPQNVHTLLNPVITRLQEAYVRKVIDTINDLDNILYEIINESGSYSTAWQYHMITYVKDYEATKPKRHPVGMTFQYSGGLNTTLFNSPADWVGPGYESGNYLSDPKQSTGNKVVLSDNDHLGGSGTGTRSWIWKSFTRGLNPIFMDRYVLPDSVTNNTYKYGEEIRKAMGHTRTYAERIPLLLMEPRSDISSSGYALVGKFDYLTYLPTGGNVLVNLSASAGMFSIEWFNVGSGVTLSGGTTSGGAIRSFTAPFSGDAVLYLHSEGAPQSLPKIPEPPSNLQIFPTGP